MFSRCSGEAIQPATIPLGVDSVPVPQASHDVTFDNGERHEMNDGDGDWDAARIVPPDEQLAGDPRSESSDHHFSMQSPVVRAGGRVIEGGEESDIAFLRAGLHYLGGPGALRDRKRRFAHLRDSLPDGGAAVAYQAGRRIVARRAPAGAPFGPTEMVARVPVCWLSISKSFAVDRGGDLLLARDESVFTDRSGCPYSESAPSPPDSRAWSRHTLPQVFRSRRRRRCRRSERSQTRRRRSWQLDLGRGQLAFELLPGARSDDRRRHRRMVDDETDRQLDQ
jgi:hypothetical protein